MTELPAVGDPVRIDSPGHRVHGATGIVEYHSPWWGTVGVTIEGATYGFLPSEVIPSDI